MFVALKEIVRLAGSIQECVLLVRVLFVCGLFESNFSTYAHLERVFHIVSATQESQICGKATNYLKWL